MSATIALEIFATINEPSPRDPLTPDRILSLAEGHCAQTGLWPTQKSGPIADAPGETWAGLDSALRFGGRGLPGGDSLARLLRRAGRIGERRGRRPKISRRLLESLYASGLSLAAIGRTMGVSRQAVWEMAKRTALA